MLLRITAIAVPFVWFGLVLGLSFIEAPLKFRAPGITLPLGLGIGRLVFSVLNKVEIVLALGLSAVTFAGAMRGPPNFMLAAIVIILAAQTIWLLPALGVRTDAVIRGAQAPFSRLHIVYIVFESIKLVLLLALGILTARHYLNGINK